MPRLSRPIWRSELDTEVRRDDTIYSLIIRRAKQHGEDPAVCRRRDVGGWHEVTIRQLQREVDECALGLIGLGLNTGDRLAIMSSTRYEWTILDLAALSLGVVVVPIYESDSAEQIRFITTETQPRLIICDTSVREAIVRQAAGDIIELILCIETDGMRTIAQAGATVDPEQLYLRQQAVTCDSLATIIYTSGTTATPKGVMLTHRNFVATVFSINQAFPQIILSRHTRFLLFLPLAHVLARFVQLAILSGRGCFAHCPNTANLLDDIDSFQPSLLLLVPRVLEKVYNAAEAKAGAGVKRKLFRWAASRAITYSQAQETRLGPSLTLRQQLSVADRLVLRKIRRVMGRNMRYIISGGAPMSPTLGHFYRGLGLTVLEGWGLSETTGPVTLLHPTRPFLGSVGPVLPGNALTTTAEGEVLVKGNAVFAGYYNDEDATREAFVDGWFRTGDMGSFDRHGNLYLTGRTKDLLVTAGGKNVAPAPLEESLVTHPLISHVVVVGDQRPFIGALITLDAEMLPTWLTNHGLTAMDATTAAHEPRVLESIQKAINRANKRVSRAESIRKFRIVNAEFTVDNGYLTPSLKLKRALVTRDFAQEIDALYGQAAKS